MRFVLPVLFAVIACTPACHVSHEVDEDAVRNPTWDALAKATIEAHYRAHPEFAVYQGRHEFDGDVSDFSAAGIAADVKRLKDAIAAADRFDDALLSPAQRIERTYLRTRLDGDLFWIERARWPWKNPQYYADAFSPDVYLSRRYAPLEKRLDAYVKWCDHVPAAAASVQANFTDPMPRPYVDVGLLMFGGLADLLAKDAPATFAGAGTPEQRAALAAANARARDAFEGLRRFFESKRASQDESFALGPELFAEMLRRVEGVTTHLDELLAIGERDFDRNRTALQAECEKIAPGKSLAEAVAIAIADKPAASPVEVARAQLSGLRQFLVDHDVVAIPGTEQAEVAEAPPHKRWNFAYIEIPGPFEHDVPSTYCISPPDPKWSAEEQRAYIPCAERLLFTSAHEVWPGHFLQYLHANRAESLVGRTYGGYAFTEGWAHYCEEMMWDEGLGNGDPKTHVGQLLSALVRNARFVAAIDLHTRGAKLEDVETMFRERGMQDAGTARQQAARGTFDPAYLSYTMGKLMILKLRKDWQAEHPGASLKQFHDTLLSFGGPPLPVLRSAMLKTDDGKLF